MGLHREDHRLVVKAMLMDKGFTEREANQIITDWFMVEGIITDPTFKPEEATWTRN
jgi:hypothetical protein